MPYTSCHTPLAVLRHLPGDPPRGYFATLCLVDSSRSLCHFLLPLSPLAPSVTSLSPLSLYSGGVPRAQRNGPPSGSPPGPGVMPYGQLQSPPLNAQDGASYQAQHSPDAYHHHQTHPNAVPSYPQIANPYPHQTRNMHQPHAQQHMSPPMQRQGVQGRYYVT